MGGNAPFSPVSPRLVNFVLLMYNQLTSEQRYAIYLGIKRKIPKRKITRAIEVHPSTVFRPLVFTICNVDISCCKIKEVAN